jgi:hypothetical protein
MSTSTNANTVTKVYSFAGNELNSAVKGIIWNILDERPHKAYLNRIHKVAIIRRQLLQILAITAGIRQQAVTITNIATNTYVAAVSLNNPMKTFNVQAFKHINELIKELSISANFNAKKHAYAIAETIIDMLNDLPNKGNHSEIEAANRMVRAYRYPVPTRPSTPENVEMEPIPIPTPKATTSAWQRTFQQLADQANKENIPPTSPAPTNHPTNWNSPSLMHEVHHLRNYLMSVPHRRSRQYSSSPTTSSSLATTNLKPHNSLTGISSSPNTMMKERKRIDTKTKHSNMLKQESTTPSSSSDSTIEPVPGTSPRISDPSSMSLKE